MKTIFTKAQIIKQEDDNSFTAVASTSTVDRHGEIVDVSGWNLKNFKKNPVLLWSHDHTIPAIGRATKIWVDKTQSKAKLMFKGEWQTVTQEGREAAELVKQGILNSFSVGFIPTDMDGNKYLKQELLEISLVNVPANPDAVALAYKSFVNKGMEEEKAREYTDDLIEAGTFNKVVDKELDKPEDEDTTAKVPTTAPKAQEQVIRSKQSLTKAILKASDKLLTDKSKLADDESVKLIKAIKRAGEILSKTHKGEMRSGTTSRTDGEES